MRALNTTATATCANGRPPKTARNLSSAPIAKSRRDFAIGALDKFLAVFGGLPFAQVAVAVVFRALIVKAVRHLMPDDYADATEVDGRINVGIEKRGLQDARGEVDVVHRRVVIGIYRRRRHAPLFLIDRLAELVEVVVALEHGAATRIAERIVALDVQG